MRYFFKKNAFYILAGSIGMGYAVFSQSAKDINLGKSEIAQKASHSSLLDVGGAANSLAKPLTKASSEIQDVARDDANICKDGCEVIQTILQTTLDLDDVRYETLLGSLDPFTKFLRDNPKGQRDFIDIAMSTSDGNKRDLIIDAFTQLPKAQAEVFAFELLNADGWQLRSKAPQLLEHHDGLSEEKIEAYFEALGQEANPYVKKRLLQTLTSNAALAQSENLIPSLNAIIQYTTNESTRSSALSVKMDLNPDVSSRASDAMHALRSGQAEFQLTGLLAFETLLENADTRQTIDKRALQNQLNYLRESTRFSKDDQTSLRLLNEADTMYERHFETDPE